MDNRELEFSVKGTLSIPKAATLLYTSEGEIRGWLTSEGKQVLLIVALEVDEGAAFLSKSDEMMSVAGCDILEYHETILTDESDD